MVSRRDWLNEQGQPCRPSERVTASPFQKCKMSALANGFVCPYEERRRLMRPGWVENKTAGR